MPQLWVVAGPNGAGKSTLTRRYLEGRLPIVNPDVIAQELAPADPTRARVRLQAGRYSRSMANLATALQIVDRAFMLDNSGQRRRLLLSMERGQVKRRSRNLPRWAHHALPAALTGSPILDC